MHGVFLPQLINWREYLNDYTNRHPFETKFGLESRCKTLINSLQLRKVDVTMICYDALESYIDEAIKSAYNAGVTDTTKI